MIVGLLVALPLTGIALHRVGVRLSGIARRVIRPLLAERARPRRLRTAVAGFTSPVVQLVVVGSVGFVTYALVAVSRSELRRWIALLPSKKRRAAAAESVTTPS